MRQVCARLGADGYLRFTLQLGVLQVAGGVAEWVLRYSGDR